MGGCGDEESFSDYTVLYGEREENVAEDPGA